MTDGNTASGARAGGATTGGATAGGATSDGGAPGVPGGRGSAPAVGTAPRGRPRSAAVDRSVIDAVMRLISEGTSIGDLTMEGIARRAGVGKATLYRRWPGKEPLLLDVLATLDGPPPAGTETGDLRADLVRAVEFIRRRSLAKRESALLRTMVTQMQSNPELWRRYHDTVIAGRRRMLVGLLERGIASGEIRPELGADLELLCDMVAGPVLARATLHPDAPLPPDLADRVVDTLLDGMRPRRRSGDREGPPDRP